MRRNATKISGWILDDDSPRKGEIAEAQAQQAAELSARCPKDGTLAKPGTKFCPNCGADAKGAKFCPECGTKLQ